jgi:molybdate transport system substrate-binding protein
MVKTRTLVQFALLALAALGAHGPARAGELNVAVASNFADTLRALAGPFEAATGHAVSISPGSTGKHYAQIVNGAPFDLYFAADTEHPRRLEASGHAVRGTRFTYARGALVLWSPYPGLVDDDGKVLRTGNFRFLAIANPELAPYGRAARETLQALGLWASLDRRLVRGENVGQAYQFVRTGNVRIGFVARSQLDRPGQSARGSSWEVPRQLYAPIEQQAVLLKDSEAGRRFLEFVQSAEALQLIQRYGYLKP